MMSGFGFSLHWRALIARSPLSNTAALHDSSTSASAAQLRRGRPSAATHGVLACTLGLTGGGMTQAVRAECEYSIRFVEPAECNSFAAEAINNLGVVTGRLNCGITDHVFTWDETNGLTPVPLTGRGLDINDEGVVVGWTETGTDLDGEAFIYDHGTITMLGTTPDGEKSEALAVSSSGLVLGFWGRFSLGGVAGPFIHKDGTTTDLIPVMPFPDSFPADLNDAGVMAGYWDPIDQERRAFTYDVTTGEFTSLPIVTGAERMWATAINELGVVVGRAVIQWASPSISSAFVSFGGVSVEIPRLPTYSRCLTQAVNRKGVVAGTCNDSDTEPDRAFIWRNSTVTNLADLVPSGDLDDDIVNLVVDINDRGQILLNVDGPAFAIATPHFDSPADITADCAVDFLDLLTMLASWGFGPAVSDLDASGSVDVADLVTLLSEWTN